MNQLNLNKQLTDLKRQELPGDVNNMGKILAETLSYSNEGNSIKIFDWAIKLYNGGVIEVDDTDLDFIKKFVESTKQMSVLCKAQILQVIRLHEPK